MNLKRKGGEASKPTTSDEEKPADKFRLSPTDVESLVKALFAAMSEEISTADYYHDKAFACILKLLLKTFRKIEAHQELQDYERRLKHKDEEKENYQANLEWFRAQRAELHRIMNVADLKLCEFYWLQIKQNCSGSDDFKRMMVRLKLFDLMSKQVKVFMPSKSIQESVANIIMECLFIDREIRNKKSQKVNVEELVKISMNIFSVASSPQASSYCMYTFLTYLNQPEVAEQKVEESKWRFGQEQQESKKDIDEDTELDKALRAQDMKFAEKTADDPATFLMKLINHNGCVIEKTLVEHLHNKSYAPIVDPACRLMVYFFRRAPDLVFRKKVSRYIVRQQTSRIETLERQ